MDAVHRISLTTATRAIDLDPTIYPWVGPEGSLRFFPKRGSRRLDHLRRADWGDEWCRDSDTTGRFSLLLDRRREGLRDAIWGFFFFFFLRIYG